MDSTRHYGCLSMGSNLIQSTNFKTIIMEYNEFVADVLEKVKQCPKCWRKGQSVFNVVDEYYGVARTVQFVDGVDCFYVDDYIDDFLLHSYKRLKEIESCEN